jgi:DNA-binding LytR/AlgR family response regulator
MIKCVIIDDEQSAIDVLQQYIGRLPYLELVTTATNPILGIAAIKKEKSDVVFLDIQMEEMNGLEVARILGDCNIVFCTAHSEFSVASYDLAAIDYLMKPIEFDRFVKAVQRVSGVLAHRPRSEVDAIPHDYIFVKTGQRGTMLKIDLDDIDYLEGMNHYVAFHWGGRKTLVHITMKEIEDWLPPTQFARVHKSFIVALREIASIEINELILKKSASRIPIGPNYKDAFLAKMKDRLMR